MYVIVVGAYETVIVRPTSATNVVCDEKNLLTLMCWMISRISV